MRLLDIESNRRLTIENPSGASGSGGKLARAFAAELGAAALREEAAGMAAGRAGEAPRRSKREGATTDTKRTIELLLHSGDVLGKAAGKLHESLKSFMRGVKEQRLHEEEQRRYQQEKEAEAVQSAAGVAENKFGGGGEASAKKVVAPAKGVVASAKGVVASAKGVVASAKGVVASAKGVVAPA